jgi:putative salt-induced outer membrane protein YdiY
MRKIALATLLAGSLLADMQVGEMKQHIELGYLGTTGNSESQTVHGKYENDYQFAALTDMHFKADAFYGEKDGDRTDERYRGHFLTNHYLREDKKWYVYGEVGALRNIFEGYNQQYNAGLGMGYVFIDDDKQLFKTRGGYQYRHANFTDGTEDDMHYLKLGANYNYYFSKTSTIESELNFLEDLESADDFETVFRIALKTAIIDHFSVRIGFEVKYDNTPPLDDNGKELENTDTTTTVGIVYDF